MPHRPIVAIDGPAGAGKSTVTRQVARQLGYVHIDTGAMYRAVALAARRSGVEWSDPQRLAELASGLEFSFRSAPADGGEDDVPQLHINGEDVSQAIRSPEISRGASQVSQWPEVRAVLVARQRSLGQAGGVVMEGRDIGTVVFPRAEVKVYLTATPEERARRRTLELRGCGEEADEAIVLSEVQERDRRDTERAHSPLCKADDAVEIVTDGLTLPQVVERLTALAREREQP